MLGQDDIQQVKDLVSEGIRTQLSYPTDPYTQRIMQDLIRKLGFPFQPSQGDIIYFDGNNWVSLLAGTSGQLLKTNGTSANPSWGLGFPTSPAQGDILYYNGSAWVSLVAGTSGQLLKTQGASANPLWATIAKYGGTGVDGALAISSGTTTINAGGAAFVVMNYTSISITGTASLTISNPGTNGTILVLKSQGNVTITSSANPTIEMSAMGGTGGAAASSAGSAVASPGGGGAGTFASGNDGVTAGNQTDGSAASGGGAGVGIVQCNGGNGGFSTTKGVGGTSPRYTGLAIPINKCIPVACGGGGGGGAKGSGGSGGAGGAGGGGLYIECGGALNITSTLNANGVTGSAGSTTSASGGGGGGGSIVISYATVTVSGGTYNVAAGGGGLDSGSVHGGGAGGAGFSAVAQNTEFL